jgi:uncharacterized C2H2 Zn-finger protein
VITCVHLLSCALRHQVLLLLQVFTDGPREGAGAITTDRSRFPADVIKIRKRQDHLEDPYLWRTRLISRIRLDDGEPPRNYDDLRARRDEHWTWVGAREADGRAVVRHLRKKLQVSRFLHTLIRGTPDPRLVMKHACGVMECVNPDHFDLVSRGSWQSLTSKQSPPGDCGRCVDPATLSDDESTLMGEDDRRDHEAAWHRCPDCGEVYELARHETPRRLTPREVRSECIGCRDPWRLTRQEAVAARDDDEVYGCPLCARLYWFAVGESPRACSRAQVAQAFDAPA